MAKRTMVPEKAEDFTFRSVNECYRRPNSKEEIAAGRAVVSSAAAFLIPPKERNRETTSWWDLALGGGFGGSPVRSAARKAEPKVAPSPRPVAEAKTAPSAALVKTADDDALRATIERAAALGRKFEVSDVDATLRRGAEVWVLRKSIVSSFLGEMQAIVERGGRLSAGQAKGVLNWLRNSDDARRSAPVSEDLEAIAYHERREDAEPQVRQATPKVVDDGIYRTPEGAIFKVQIAHHGSGNLYAKRLVVEDGAGRFEYEAGAIRRLRPEWRMTLEDAKAFGALYGVCCNCGRTLTDEGSIEAGIGPVCAGKFAA